MAVDEEDFALVTRREARYFAGELAGEEKQILEGDVLAERDQVDFVVTAEAVAGRVNYESRVVVEPALLIGREVCSYVANDEGCVCFECNCRKRVLEFYVLLKEGGWGFRPYH